MIARGLTYQRATALGLLMCLVLAGPTTTLADDVDDLIDQILAKDGSGAKAAGELLKTAKEISGSPKNQTRLCQKAYECGITESAGYSSAAAALDLLDKCAPDQADAWDAKRLNVYRLRYLRGPRDDKVENGRAYVKILLAQVDKCGKAGQWSSAVKYCGLANGVAWALKLPEKQTTTDLMRHVKSRMTVAKRLASLEKALEKNPADLLRRKQLVETHLIDMDMPAEALKHLSDKLDTTLRSNVTLAAGEMSNLTEADLMTLGQWYRKLVARTVSKTAKFALLTRAQDYLKRYLELHAKADIPRARGLAALGAVQADLDKLNAPPTVKKTTATGAKTLTLKLGNGIVMKFVRIPAGKFTMGSPKTENVREADEGPQRQVAISRQFYMGVTEVTQAQYTAVMGKNPSKLKGPYNPVEQVSWKDCAEFCTTMSRKSGRPVRLPTEAQWEYACRAGTNTRFNFDGGNSELRNYAWFKGNGGGKAHPVGQKKPNAWGLYDMHGNVWEWCSDWLGTSYDGAGARDPKGVDSGKEHVLRGGSFYDNPRLCRSAKRHGNFDAQRVGFRVIVASGPGAG